MKVKKLKNTQQKIIEGPLEIIPDIFHDERGYFLETWNENFLSFLLIQIFHLFKIINLYLEKELLEGFIIN